VKASSFGWPAKSHRFVHEEEDSAFCDGWPWKIPHYAPHLHILPPSPSAAVGGPGRFVGRSAKPAQKCPPLCIERMYSGFTRDFDEHTGFPLVIVYVIRNLDVLPRSVDLEAEPGLQAGGG